MTKLGGLGPNQTKKDTEEHMKAHFEEVEQVDEAKAKMKVTTDPKLGQLWGRHAAHNSDWDSAYQEYDRGTGDAKGYQKHMKPAMSIYNTVKEKYGTKMANRMARHSAAWHEKTHYGRYYSHKQLSNMRNNAGVSDRAFSKGLHTASGTRLSDYLDESLVVNSRNIDEKAPPGAKYERMVKHIKAKYATGGLTDAEKRKAYGAAWKAYNAQKMEEDVEQVEEASEKEAPYLAQFVPNADAPMRDHLAFPVHSTDEKDAHRAFERTFGKKMKADYTLHGIFPADVNEEVERVTEGKVSGYKMYRNPDNTWYVEDEDEGVVLRNASQGEAEHMVWSGNQKLKGAVNAQPAARKTIKNRMEEEVEQVDEAPRYKHVATFVPLSDSGEKTTLHVPVNVEDGDDEHKNKLARLLGNERAKKFKLHGVFPRKVVEEEVEQVDESNYVSPMTGKPFTSRLNPLRRKVSPFSKVGKSLMRSKLQSGEDEAAYAATNYDMTQSGMSNLQRNRARLHKAAGRLGVDLYEEEVEQVDEETPPARVIAAQKKFDLEAKANARNTEQAGSAAADRRAEIIRKAKEELAKRKSLAEAKKPDDKEKKIVVGGKGANKEKVSVTPSIPGDSPDSKPGTERN